LICTAQTKGIGHRVLVHPSIAVVFAVATTVAAHWTSCLGPAGTGVATTDTGLDGGGTGTFTQIASPMLGVGGGQNDVADATKPFRVWWWAQDDGTPWASDKLVVVGVGVGGGRGRGIVGGTVVDGPTGATKPWCVGWSDKTARTVGTFDNVLALLGVGGVLIGGAAGGGGGIVGVVVGGVVVGHAYLRDFVAIGARHTDVARTIL
jgi:hypothetical protein